MWCLFLCTWRFKLLFTSLIENALPTSNAFLVRESYALLSQANADIFECRYFKVFLSGIWALSAEPKSLSLPQLSNRSYAKFILAESYSSRFTTFHSSAKDSTPDISYWDSHVITVTYCTLTQCFQITRDFLQNTSHIAETLYVFSSGAVFF